MSDEPDQIVVTVSASVEGDAVVEGPQVVIATSGGPIAGTVLVSAVPLGDAVIDGPQIVQIISGPPGPMGPAGVFSSELSLGLANAMAAIAFEANVRATVDQAQADVLTALTALVGANEASITSLSTAFADQTSAFASQLTSLTANVGANAAAIASEATARSTADTAFASSITSLTATVAGNAAAITTEATTRATSDAALASMITALGADVGANHAAILTEASVRASADTAMAASITSLNASVGANASAITTEATTRAGADNALSTLITTLTSTVSGNTSAISAETTARTTADSALATRATNLETEVTNARGGKTNLLARITEVDTARATADTALASSITSLTSSVGSNATAITTEATTRANADTALSTLITSLTSVVSGHTASISTEATTRANADTAISALITSLTSTVSGNTAAITAEATARATADSAISTTLTSVSARADSATAGGLVRLVATAVPTGSAAAYEWQIVAGSKSVGMRAVVTSGGVGRIEFLADQFRIYNAAGDAGIPVFAIDSGHIVMTGDVRINGSLVIGTIDDGVLPLIPGLLAPSEIYPIIYQVLYDDTGRITEAFVAGRINNLQFATDPVAGQIPYIAAVVPGVGSAPDNEFWSWVSTSSVTRAFLSAADKAAARAAIDAAAIGGGGSGGHTHDAGDIITGTLASARLPTLVTALAGQYILKQSMDAQGRTTGYAIAIRALNIENLGAGATGSIPYVSSYSTPNETWGWITSTSFGRSLMQAANGAAALSLVGAAAASHVHSAADITSGTIADARLPSLISPLASQYLLKTAVDAQGRVTGYTIAIRVLLIENMTTAAASGAVPYVSAYSTPNETWGWVVTTATGRSVMTAANGAAVLSTIGGAAASHIHAASDITSGTLADARLPSLITALAGQYVIQQSLDVAGRVTGYSLAIRLMAIEALSSGAASRFPYVSSYSTPNETWGWMNIGTSGAAVPLLNGANTWSSSQVVQGAGVGGVRIESGAANIGGMVTFLNSDGTRKGFIGYSVSASNAGDIWIYSDSANGFQFNQVPNVAGNTMWHAGNDGVGSGLDSDLLDGQHGSYYNSASNLNAGTVPDARMKTLVTALAGEYVIKQSIDVAGRVTGYTLAIRLNSIETMTGQAAGSIPYISSYALPNETWGFLASTAAGRAVLAGAIDSIPIGATTRSTGAFTTLAANSNVSFTGGNVIYNDGTINYRVVVPSGGVAYTGTFSNHPVAVQVNNSVIGVWQLTGLEVTGILTLTRSDDGNLIVFRRGGSTVGTVSITSAGTSYNITSDYRWKTKVMPFADAETRLRAVAVYQGEVLNAPGVMVDFFIAHELQEQVPYAVTGMKDAVNDNRAPIYQQVDLSKVVPLHHAAIQVLFDEKDQIKKRIAALEEEIADLKKKAA